MHRVQRLPLILAVTAIACRVVRADEAKRWPLADIRALLAACPPRPAGAPERARLYEALDAWALAPDTVYWDGQFATARGDYAAFYRNRIAGALQQVETTEVSSGAVVWKLYSSGFLIKTPHRTFAFDAVEGPYKDINSTPDADSFRFCWTDEMRRRFGRLVDVLFITHWHYDHCSFALARSVVAAGGIVVVPRQLREHWSRHDWASQLRVVESEEDVGVRGLTVRVFHGAQRMQQDEVGNWIDSPHNAENNVYLVRDGDGVSFLDNGDNRGPDFIPWLRTAVADGWRVSVWLHILGYPRDLLTRVTQTADPVILPGHEHELGHKPKFGVSTLVGRWRGLRPRLTAGKAVMLVWGESARFDD